MKDKIKHDGVIESIDSKGIHVRIIQTSACASCKVAQTCRASEQKVKIVDVLDYTGKYHVGDSVVVSASRNTAVLSLLLGFGLPLIVMVGCLIAMMLITGDEGLSALCSLVALLPYYLILFLFRHRISRKVYFSID